MSTVPRILFIDHTARMGGGEVALLNLVVALDHQRYVPVVLLFADGPLRQKLEDAGIETHLLPLAADVADARKDTLGGKTLLQVGAMLRTMRFVWRVRRKIGRLRPAIVHTNSLKADIIGGLAGRLSRVPVIWHVRDRIADDYLPPRVVRLFRWLAGWVPRIVIANSRSTLETLDRDTRGIAIPSGTVAKLEQSGYQVIHDGTLHDEADVREGVGNSDVLLIGLVGRIARWKGQHVFIEAARQLRTRFPRSRFQIIGSPLFGEDAYERELHDTVDRERLGDVVEFAGFREDVGAAIAALDVLVHASITGEPFGQVIVEGMTAAKPVVATRGGGVPEIVVDGDTGLLVPMDDADAMAYAVGRLLGDPALRERMGRRGRQRVAEHFTIRHTADKVQRVYDELLQRATRGTR